ncbi:MAG: FliH/SctL family protein [Phycisphaerae bacterium]|nr:FliH/SctL family protein [Phycisphaerae bacterium]
MVRRSMVIKAAEALPLKGAALKPFHLSDMMGEVKEAVIQAQADAARIVRQAKTQEEAIRRAGYEAGYQAGFAKGMEEGRTKGHAEAFAEAEKEFAETHKNLVSSCERIIAEIEERRAAWEAAARQDLVDLAMAIARRVVRHVSESDRQVVVENLEEAIRLAGERSDVTIKVNPADAEAARVFAESLADRQASCKLVKVVESPDLSPGGCWIQWGSGAVDARIETQLDRIAAGLGSREMPAADKPVPNTVQEGPINT